MSDTQAVGPVKSGRIKLWFTEKAVYAWTIASGVIGVGGLWANELGLLWKIVLCVVVAGLAVVSFHGFTLRARRQKTETRRANEAEGEVARLRAQLEESAPDRILDSVGMSLFVRPGAWRLTLFILEKEKDEKWCLSPLSTRASSEVYEALPHARISLLAGPLREIVDVDANDSLHPFTNESGNLPDRNADPELWREMIVQIIGRTPSASDMPTRKLGWTVVREPASRRTYVLLSESVLPDGIRTDVVRSQLLSVIMILISRLIGLEYHSAGVQQLQASALASR